MMGGRLVQAAQPLNGRHENLNGCHRPVPTAEAAGPQPTAPNVPIQTLTTIVLRISREVLAIREQIEELNHAASRRGSQLATLESDVKAVFHCLGAINDRLDRPEVQPQPSGPGPQLAGLSPVEAAVLAALTTEPQSAKYVARLSGYHLRSVQAALTALCRRDPPLARRSADGVSLIPRASAPAPE
jgi:hypothetical protein